MKGMYENLKLVGVAHHKKNEKRDSLSRVRGARVALARQSPDFFVAPVVCVCCVTWKHGNF